MAGPRDCPLPAMPTAAAHLEYAPYDEPDQLLALYSEHAATARALACRLLYDRSEAEDVVQDVFLTVLRNRSLDHLRRRCSRPLEDVGDLAERLSDPHTENAFDELEAIASGELLWRLV